MLEEQSSRDIYEVAELFEDLLFMRTEKFSKRSSEDSKFILSKDSVELLGRLGIVGRIFRRWYQTTWGWNNPSRFFQGETPRMELAQRYPELNSGDAYVGVQLLQDEASNEKVVPSLYDRKEIENAGGLFALGRKFLPATLDGRRNFHRLSPPNFDPDFKNFVSMIEEIEGEIRQEGSEKLPDKTEERAWQVFWPNACMTIPLNCEIEIPHGDLIAISSMMRLVLESVAKEQAGKFDNYISFDILFETLWEIFRKFDRRLLPKKAVMSDSGQKIAKLMNQPDGPYSLKVFYNLGNLLDELLLFPADRYFGAVECVWVDKVSFANDLAVSISLLKNNLEMPPSPRDQLAAEQKKFYDETGIEQHATDIYRIWFSPPSYLRFLPKFLDYF